MQAETEIYALYEKNKLDKQKLTPFFSFIGRNIRIHKVCIYIYLYNIYIVPD